MNFHWKDGTYFRRDGDNLVVAKAKDFDDPGETMFVIDVGTLASIVSSFSPHQEMNGSFWYIHDFLTAGTMFCGGCGAKLTADKPGMHLSVINLLSCDTCYKQKFKPFFDYLQKRT